MYLKYFIFYIFPFLEGFYLGLLSFSEIVFNNLGITNMFFLLDLNLFSYEMTLK